MTVAVQPIRDRMHAARVRDIDQAVAQRTITADEAAQLKAAAEAVAAACAVDDFAPEELTARGANKEDVSSQAIITNRQPQPRSGRVERRPVYIIDGSRTPFIKARGSPARSRRSTSRCSAAGRCCCASRSRRTPSTR